MSGGDERGGWAAEEFRRRSKGKSVLPSRLRRAEEVEVPALGRQLQTDLARLDRQAAQTTRALRCRARLFLQRQLERRRRGESLYQAVRSAAGAGAPQPPGGTGHRRDRAARPAGRRARRDTRASTLPSPAPRSGSVVSTGLELVLLDWALPGPPLSRPRSSSAPSVLADALWAPGRRATHALSPPPPRRRPLSGEPPPPAAPRRHLRASFCREMARRAEGGGQREEGLSPPPPQEDPVQAVLERFHSTLVVVERPTEVVRRRSSGGGSQPQPRHQTPIGLRLTGSGEPY